MHIIGNILLLLRSETRKMDQQLNSELPASAAAKISYCQPDDPWILRKIIFFLEIIFGSKKVFAIYEKLRREPFEVGTFFRSAMQETKIQCHYDPDKLNKIPRQGPLVIVANHPFGIVDGLIMCDIAARVRGNFRILINSVLCVDDDLNTHFLPVNFDQTKEAVKTNISSKKRATDDLKNDIPLVIFPSGHVSTADKFGFGSVVDAPWTTFAAKLIRESNATVVPIFFRGQNSRLFHVASHISMALRSALLLNEARRRFGEEVRIEIGDPISWERLEVFETRQELTNFLYDRVQSLQ